MLYREHNSPPQKVNGKAVLVVSTRTKQSPRPFGRGLGEEHAAPELTSKHNPTSSLLHLRQYRPTLISLPSEGEISASNAAAGVTSVASAAATAPRAINGPAFTPACGFLNVPRTYSGERSVIIRIPLLSGSIVKSSCSEAKLAVPVTLINAFSVSKAKSAGAPRRWQYSDSPPRSSPAPHRHQISHRQCSCRHSAQQSPSGCGSPARHSSTVSGCRYCCLKRRHRVTATA